MISFVQHPFILWLAFSCKAQIRSTELSHMTASLREFARFRSDYRLSSMPWMTSLSMAVHICAKCFRILIESTSLPLRLRY
ncbi:hypothetical protein SISSUDRAFT_437666 [Sistotremastrum suecicum HHB10207 ss-3]|uniref:Secreted protein n=1 Tax=Sistotremastrum suecicum HHB10207 ss-3 TaxID=1314776 RepID=A0A166FJ30_9AGAM|nr:hypothetical protein SISSUDRAFT_437666 [Sistotremastrum suecicum HHB10207 ss-3]